MEKVNIEVIDIRNVPKNFIERPTKNSKYHLTSLDKQKIYVVIIEEKVLF